MPSFWAELFGCQTTSKTSGKGLLFANIMQKNSVKGKNKGAVSILHSLCACLPLISQSTLLTPSHMFHCYFVCSANGVFPTHEDSEFPAMPVGVALHGLTKTYGRRHAIHNLNLSFYEGHVTTLLGHNGAGKTTTM